MKRLLQRIKCFFGYPSSFYIFKDPKSGKILKIHPKDAAIAITTIEERDSMPLPRRAKNMKVYIENEHRLFILKKGITNKHWKEIVIKQF